MSPKSPICSSHADPPTASAVNAVVLAAVGEEAVLLCEVSGVPLPRVIWYRGTSGGGGAWEDVPSVSPHVETQFSRTVMRGGALRMGYLGGLACSSSTPSPGPASTRLSGEEQDLE